MEKRRMTTPLLILGAGTFATEVLDIAEAAGEFAPLGFVNSLEAPAPGTTHEGLPVYGLDDLPCGPGDCRMIAAIVSVKRRGFIEAMQARGYRFISVIHPSAVVSRRANVAAGCVVHANVVISSNTHVGPHVILNRGSLIGHDDRIGAFCTIGPGANIAGGVEIGASAYIGVGAVIRDHVGIGAEAVAGAGAVVVKSVPDQVMVAGVPARIMQHDVKGM
jgi:sugar O-acyltransferase (sialic acid O-acetyltransferase NeuD family)